MRSRPANVSLIHRRCSGRSAAPGREEHHSTEPHPLTFCSMSELLAVCRNDVPLGAELHRSLAVRLAGLVVFGVSVERMTAIGDLPAAVGAPDLSEQRLL